MRRDEGQRVGRDLGDGLVLRRATSADVERVAAFNGVIHRRSEVEEANRATIATTLDLAEGRHPTCGASDFTYVEDTRTGAVVSSLCLIPQTWTYDGVPVPVGRPELVGTDPGYRDRGLVRAQFEAIHRWSAERGDLLLGITGIPWFYRQFGYEMAVDLGAGRVAYPATVPRLRDGQVERVRIRPADASDARFLAEIYAHGARRSLLSCIRDERTFRYEVAGRRAGSSERLEFRVVETIDGTPLGFLAHWPSPHQSAFGLAAFELRSGVAWGPATESVLRYVRATGEECARRDGKGPCESFWFGLGAAHPAYDALPSAFPHARRPYAWFVRVPDVPAFLRRVTPVLDRRIASSIVEGFTGELRLSFYRDGVRLVFVEGTLSEVEPWQPTRDQEGDARFPGLTFLQLLFGYRTMEELEYAFADCRAGADSTRALLQALFPKRPSQIWGID